jgi:hypothetical protein
MKSLEKNPTMLMATIALLMKKLGGGPVEVDLRDLELAEVVGLRILGPKQLEIRLGLPEDIEPIVGPATRILEMDIDGNDPIEVDFDEMKRRQSKPRKEKIH